MNMKRILAALAFLPVVALAATVATVTPGDWPLYRGSTIVARYATEAACVDAAKALGVARTYTCRTTDTVVVSIVADPPPPPPPVVVPPPVVPAAVGVLDDFEGDTKAIGGHPLWDVYQGEGARGSAANAASAARFGGKGLAYTMTAGTPYLHFFSNNGSQWLFAHEFVTGWTQGAYNRMSFWVKHPANLWPGTNNGHLIEFGTYTRSKNGATSTQNDGGTHFYHYYNPRPGVWTKVIVDNHPQHYVGGPTSDPGVVSDGTWNYTDSLTRFYWNAPYAGPGSYPSVIAFDDFRMYSEQVAEDVANISSIEASYDGDTLHVGFARNSRDDATYTARWSTSDITTPAQFAAATLLGSVGPDGRGDYVNKQVEGRVTISAPVVYIAVQKAGRSDFRRIALELQ